MIIHESEINDGLAGLIKANASIAVAAVANKFSKLDKEIYRTASSYRGAASELDEDLYPVKSLFVSTNNNLNTDIFLPDETWAARHTPEDKPDNLNHDEHEIVGHMTGVWAVDAKGSLIPDTTPIGELPSLFHLITSGVIYTAWSDPEYIKRTSELIDGIERGEICVSMEVLFDDFDYGVWDTNGDPQNYEVIKRNAATAHMTRYLRAYGGSGVYQDKSIGRVLRNMNFVGKGYVKNPGNPYSVILTDEQDIPKSVAGENKMTIEELMAKNAVLEAKVTELETSVSVAKSEAKKFEDEVNAVKAKTEAELAKAADELNKTDEEKKALAARVEDYTRKERDAARKAKLVDGGVAVADAEKLVQDLRDVSDVVFDASASVVLASIKLAKEAEAATAAVKAELEVAKATVVTKAEVVEPAVLETANVVEDATAGVLESGRVEESELTQIEKTRAELQKSMAEKFSLKKKQ